MPGDDVVVTDSNHGMPLLVFKRPRRSLVTGALTQTRKAADAGFRTGRSGRCIPDRLLGVDSFWLKEGVLIRPSPRANGHLCGMRGIPWSKTALLRRFDTNKTRIPEEIAHIPDIFQSCPRRPVRPFHKFSNRGPTSKPISTPHSPPGSAYHAFV